MDNDLHKPTIGVFGGESFSSSRISSGPPTSAAEYLSRVRREAASLPNVFRATPEQIRNFKNHRVTGWNLQSRQEARVKATEDQQQDKDKAEQDLENGTDDGNGVKTGTSAKQERGRGQDNHDSGKGKATRASKWTPTGDTKSMSESLRVVTCPSSLRPSEVWKEGQLRAFEEIRNYLAFWASSPSPSLPRERTVRTGKRDADNRDASDTRGSRGRRDAWPRLNDERGWMIKCMGYHFDEADDIHSVAQVREEGAPPTSEILLQLDNVMCAKLLKYHARALANMAVHDQDVLTKARALWIYALLARIAVPLSVNTSSCLRDILRLAAVVRKLHDASGTGISDGHRPRSPLSAANLLILIIESFFGQGCGP